MTIPRLFPRRELISVITLEVILLLLPLSIASILLSTPPAPGINEFRAQRTLAASLLVSPDIQDPQEAIRILDEALKNYTLTLIPSPEAKPVPESEDLQIFSSSHHRYTAVLTIPQTLQEPRAYVLTSEYKVTAPLPSWILVSVIITLGHMICLALFLKQILRTYTLPISRLSESLKRIEQREDNPSTSRKPPTEQEDIHTLFTRVFSKIHQRLTQLEYRNQELWNILQHMSDGVLVLDSRGEILIMNQAARDCLLSRTPDTKPTTIQLLGSTGLITLFEESLRAQELIKTQIITYHSDSEHTFEAAGQAVELNSHEISSKRIIILLHEVTKLQYLESVRSDFVANVSHELKTPITSILGFVETLLSDPGIDSDSRMNFLQIVHRQSNRLKNIVEDLLSLSRLEQSGKHISLAPCDPQQIMRSAIDTTGHQAAQKGIKLTLSPSSDSVPIMANEALLEQALINLIENGIKYGTEGGWVRVEARLDDTYCIFSVQDNGPGIPAREKDRVFQRFYRIDKTRSRQQGGTGLGLSIVKHIALCHHGEASVTSTMGQGSTFSLKIPRGSMPD
ncbi:sensor histidine kinase [Spirochaeta lutea]|uniref:histidine kinase n=1 Tax=Spirochaeta lutea TaxID=1480694 RepID=A0A098QTC9_9SPIO|nr:ATP-binding protein [Spirochaeta lutea]KGE70658.1 hypothetical protein DC28_14180 [Spirochaeta lutea]